MIIREATDSELPACRALLPEIFTGTPLPEVLVAVTPDDARLIGALAIGWGNIDKPPGFPLWMHVQAEWRRRGVGAALMRAAVALTAGETSCLRAARPLRLGDPAEAFLRAQGFMARHDILHFETDSRRFLAMVGRTLVALGCHGRVPKAARIVALADAPHDAVARLVEAETGTSREIVRAAITGGHYDLQGSVALMLGDRTVGALLYAWQGKMPVIDIRVVAPAQRGAWANVMLLHAATQNGLDAGSERFRFFCRDDVLDTLKLAAKCAAVTTHVERQWMRETGAPE